MYAAVDKCDVIAPAEGSEACDYRDIRNSDSNFSPRIMAGAWYGIARSDRVAELRTDGEVTYISIGDYSGANVTQTGYSRYTVCY